MTEPHDGDRAIIEAARAALQRSEVNHRMSAETPIPGSPPEWAADHAVLADHAALHAQRLADFDPGHPLVPSGSEALWAGHDALVREAASWRALGDVATEGFRAQFMAFADEHERDANAVQDLRDRMVHRDLSAELESERGQQLLAQPEAGELQAER